MSFVVIEGDVTLFSGGVELATADAAAVVAGARGFIGVGYDGTNTRFIRVDTSGYQIMVGLGTAGTPAGGVLSVQGVSGGQALPISAASLPLPSGAATEATLATLLTEATFTARIPILGQKTMAGSVPVVIASDQSVIPISDNGASLTVDDGGGSLTVDTPQLPASLVGGRLDTNVGAWLGATTPTVGQKTGAASIPVIIASDQSAIPVSQNGTWTVQQGTPPWAVAGTDADGVAPTENPVLVAGQDGTNVQTLKTDTTGHAEVVGPAADGAAPVGNPVLTAGQDGTNVQSFKTDTTGRQEVIGGAADGAAPAGNPVLVAGQDGTNVQTLKTDSVGRAEIVGPAAPGAPPVDNPVYVAGIDTDGNVEAMEMAPGGGVSIAGHLATNFTPNPKDRLGQDARPAILDSTGNLRSRSQVLTDEGVLKDPFHGTSLESSLTGTLTFTNGSSLVSGSGTSFTTELTTQRYLRNSVDGQSAYVKVQTILSDTLLILEENYGGTSGAGATGITSLWVQDNVNGTVTVVANSSEVTLNPSTGSGDRASIRNLFDYLPLVGEFRCRISQRVANQEAVVGFMDTYPSPENQAVVVFDGTDNTKIKFRTSSSSFAVDKVETEIDLTTLDLTFTSAQSLDYKIAIEPDRVVLFITDIEVAEHRKAIPDPYLDLAIVLAISNSGVVSSTDFISSRIIAQSLNQVAVASPLGDIRVRQGRANTNDQAWPLKLVSREGEDAGFGEDGRLQIGHSFMHFYDQFEGAAIDLQRWVQDQSGMAQTHAAGTLTLNSGSSTTASAYSNLVSAKRIIIFSEYASHAMFRARVIPRNEAFVSFGYGAPSGTSLVQDGVFFRFNNDQLWGVASFNGTESLVEFVRLPNTTDYYLYEITIYENRVVFTIESNDGKYEEAMTLQLSATQSSFFTQSHLPIFARVFNENPGPGSAAQLLLGQVFAGQLDVNLQKPWAEQLAGTGLSSILKPDDHTQSANYPNSAAPASAALSNTTPSYATLGGLFQFAAPVGAETDYALFGYLVPTIPGRSLYIWSVVISAINLGASVNNSTPTSIQWAVAVNSSGGSLATGAPNPPIRTAIGVQSVNKGATAGDPYQPPIISYTPRTPLVVTPGRYFHVIARVVSGVATVGQIVRGTVTVEGYFE